MVNILIILLIAFIAGLLVGFRRPADPVVVAIQTDPEQEARGAGVGCLLAVVVVAVVFVALVAR